MTNNETRGDTARRFAAAMCLEFDHGWKVDMDDGFFIDRFTSWGGYPLPGATDDVELSRHFAFVGKVAERVAESGIELREISRVFCGYDAGGWKVVFANGQEYAEIAGDPSWATMLSVLAAKGGSK